MSIESSLTGSTPSRLQSETLTSSHFSFVQQSENINASTTRRAVRSHAMKAVRRQQRQESTKIFRLKWPEEQSSPKKFRLTWPDEQSHSFGQLQIRQKHVHDGESDEPDINSTPSLELSEHAHTSGQFDIFQSDPSTNTSPPSDRTDSILSQDIEASSQNTTADTDEEIPPVRFNVQTLLGAGRINPFQTFPTRVDRSMSQLIDHCTLPHYPC